MGVMKPFSKTALTHKTFPRRFVVGEDFVLRGRKENIEIHGIWVVLLCHLLGQKRPADANAGVTGLRRTKQK